MSLASASWRSHGLRLSSGALSRGLKGPSISARPTWGFMSPEAIPTWSLICSMSRITKWIVVEAVRWARLLDLLSM